MKQIKEFRLKTAFELSADEQASLIAGTGASGCSCGSCSAPSCNCSCNETSSSKGAHGMESNVKKQLAAHGQHTVKDANQ
ncbi:MAG: hypothetical protein ACI3ZQ_04625 [Candidatus Cryptobacteroides sp.]